VHNFAALGADQADRSVTPGNSQQLACSQVSVFDIENFSWGLTSHLVSIEGFQLSAFQSSELHHTPADH
jgi:hypothetical protein